jgi:alpha 1,2-mannosyltransferase
MKVNAAIFYLTQNTEARRIYLKTSLYFLFRHFNAAHRYPVVILHEGDYDAESQREILLSVRASCRSCVTFRTLDQGDFELPPHIDADLMHRCIQTRATPYWRNEKYRMMCRWWLVHFPRYAAGYEYVMRLDDDSIIEEPIADLFAWAKEKGLAYASNMLHVDCGICCYGMKEFFEQAYPNKVELVQGLFMPQEVPARVVEIHPFRSLLSILKKPLPEGEQNKLKLWMPVMFYNNMFITRTDFWQREDVQDIIRRVDENGSIFYLRWGDAPLQSIIAMLHAEPSQISRSMFKYSKRMQREAFYGDDQQYHSYMPDTYDKSSCVTENPSFKAPL